MASSFSRTWIPNQHGAWAMLIAPVVVGALAGGPNPWHAVLLLTWLAAFCLNFYLSLAIKSRRPRRYQRQLLVYGSTTAAFGLPLVWHDVAVLRMLLAAVPAFAVHVLFVLRRNERAWLNDVVGVALAGVVGFGAYRIGNAPTDDVHALRALVAVCLYFVGTVAYVKTLIRERGNRRWLGLSFAFHALLVFTCLVGRWWIAAAVATALLGRAVAVPGRGWSPRRAGLVEIGSTVAVALTALLTLP